MSVGYGVPGSNDLAAALHNDNCWQFTAVQHRLNRPNLHQFSAISESCEFCTLSAGNRNSGRHLYKCLVFIRLHNDWPVGSSSNCPYYRPDYCLCFVWCTDWDNLSANHKASKSGRTEQCCSGHHWSMHNRQARAGARFSQHGSKTQHYLHFQVPNADYGIDHVFSKFKCAKIQLL